MSVLVKNMDMPHSCYDCPFIQEIRWDAWDSIDVLCALDAFQYDEVEDRMDEIAEKLKEGRSPCCPLEEVK